MHTPDSLDGPLLIEFLDECLWGSIFLCPSFFPIGLGGGPEGSSLYREEFPAPPPEPSPASKPAKAAQRVAVPFEGTTPTPSPETPKTKNRRFAQKCLGTASSKLKLQILKYNYKTLLKFSKYNFFLEFQNLVNFLEIYKSFRILKSCKF